MGMGPGPKNECNRCAFCPIWEQNSEQASATPGVSRAVFGPTIWEFDNHFNPKA